MHSHAERGNESMNSLGTGKRNAFSLPKPTDEIRIA